MRPNPCQHCALLWLGGVTAGVAATVGPAAMPVEVGGGELLVAAATALAAGVLLGLTPSALALALSGLGALRGARSGVRAAALALGSVAAFCALGLFALAGGGRPLAWGAQLQEPPILVLLALASLALALGLWDLLPRPLGEPPPRRPGLVAGGLLPGALLLPLVLPWSPPLIAEPVGLALQGGVAPALAVATCLALGAALPAIAAGLLPAGGEPSATRRGVLGFLPLVSVVWLLYALAPHLAADRLAYVQLALLTVALFSWLGRRAAVRPAARGVYSLAAVAAAIAAVRIAAGAG